MKTFYGADHLHISSYHLKHIEDLGGICARAGGNVLKFKCSPVMHFGVCVCVVVEETCVIKVFCVQIVNLAPCVLYSSIRWQQMRKK